MPPLSLHAGASAEASRALEACVAEEGVAVFPTDTVYGLCCDPQSATAVERLYTLKGRAPTKPAALLCFSLAVAHAILPEVGATTRAALDALLPGPVTVLLADPDRRFPLAGGELLGLRVIDSGLSLSRPVLQSSANAAGGNDPRRLEQVPREVREGADLLIDGGELPGTPSTVIDLSTLERDGGWRILRHGAVAEAAIAQALRSAVEGR